MTATLTAKWETELQEVRDRRLSVLIERDDLPEHWHGAGCLGVSIEDDLRYLQQLDDFARAAIRKITLDELAAQLLAQLGESTEHLDELSSWLELVESLDQYGPPVDDRPPRQLVTTSLHGANAPPVEDCLTFTNERGSPT